MDTSKRSPAQIYQMGVGAVIVAALLAYFFVISPQMAARADAKEAAATTLETTKLVEGRLNTLQKRVNNLDEAIDRINELTKSFPTTYKQDEFISLLDVAASSAGVDISSITTSQPADPDRFGENGEVSGGQQQAATQGKPKAGKAKPAPDGAIQATGDGVAAALPAEGGVTPGSQIGDFPLAMVTVNMNVSGSTGGIQRFIRLLADLQRPILIDSVSVSNGDDGSQADIKGRTYLSRPLEVPDFD